MMLLSVCGYLGDCCALFTGILDNDSGLDQLKFIRAIPNLVKSSRHDLDEVSDIIRSCDVDHVIFRCVKS